MKPLRLSWMHGVVWALFSAAAMIVAVQTCVEYNRIAGVDKTPRHIAGIALAMNAGPISGYVANPGGGERLWKRLMPIPAAALVAGLLPFVVFHRPIGRWVHVMGWSMFVLGLAAWYGSALVSLGVYLS